MSTPPQEITLTQTILAPPSEVYAAFTREAGWLAWCCEKAEIDEHQGIVAFLERTWGRALRNLKAVLEAKNPT